MKTVCLMSGGKDSFFSAVIAMEQGLDLEYSITVLPEKDSMMFHVPNIKLAENVASILGLRTVFVEENAFREALEDARSKGVECVVSGAIASEYQKTRIERICTELGLMSFTPLWMKDQDLVLREIIRSQVRAMIVSVSAEGLGPEFLGRYLDNDLLEDLKKVREKIPINISGEGGEFETFVTGYSFFKDLKITESEKIWQGSSGTLKINKIES